MDKNFTLRIPAGCLAAMAEEAAHWISMLGDKLKIITVPLGQKSFFHSQLANHRLPFFDFAGGLPGRAQDAGPGDHDAAALHVCQSHRHHWRLPCGGPHAGHVHPPVHHADLQCNGAQGFVQRGDQEFLLWNRRGGIRLLLRAHVRTQFGRCRAGSDPVRGHRHHLHHCG